MMDNLVDVKVYFHSQLVIVGKVPGAPGRRFSDAINADTGEFLTLQEALLSTVNNEAANMGQGASVQVRKAQIAFMVRGPEKFGEVANRRLVQVPNVKYPVAFLSFDWLLTGEISLAPDKKVEVSMRVGGAPFIPLARAKAIYLPMQSVNIEAEFALLRRDAFDSFWPYGISS